ncbi:restriction system protein [Arthrobacter pigmenti]|uniref:Restriction system protein n=1 Tax=Arthrobacter pigmenti TaxID=271432 RepID=A0A846REK2_9MICC|nr:restriction endonuclease [Arthrobacter pigmenti]NJC21463.1 restriction system protein [Arthrobacter pigmenti]
MYWLFDDETRESVRKTVELLVESLSTVSGSTQSDQLFPYVGRKDFRKASIVVDTLSAASDTIVDPFSGSGIFTYAAVAQKRNILSNEWEPFAHRMSTAPWRVPASAKVTTARNKLVDRLTPRMNYLYRAICPCGHEHVIDTQFFDRSPLRFRDVTPHPRLGRNGETVTYRRARRCPICRTTEKFFDADDQRHLDEISSIELSPKYRTLFAQPLIKNSRINLSDNWTTYGNLFPHRSKLALADIWDAITDLEEESVQLFFQDAFLAIIPQAKYKDYRSKSQDMHVPEVQLREVNIMFRFLESIERRDSRLREYEFSTPSGVSPISCADFRAFMSNLEPKSAQLVLTDPPWSDGNAYFEKAQLYHPWLDYSLADDLERLDGEMVVTDAPSRSVEHGEDRWWVDMAQFLGCAASVTRDLGYLAMYFRPIPVRRWLENLNKLKLQARIAGFEPLLTVDVSGDDPSMRIQQSASFVFSQDMVFVFLKLPEALRRRFVGDLDLDHLAYVTAARLQEAKAMPFSEFEWRREFSRRVLDEGVPEVNLPANEHVVSELFERYTREVQPGLFLIQTQTPFAGQLFDVPAAERLFAYVPTVVRELTQDGSSFTYEKFLLRLAAYVENGTRMLIQEVQGVDMRAILAPYATASEDGRVFVKREIPRLPAGISQVMELNPSQFEQFAAELLKRQGFTDVAVQGGSGDRGVDIVAKDSFGVSIVVQCKRYIGNVSATPVQRLHSFAVTRGAGRRMVVTTSGYTRDARDEAVRTDTELIDGSRLEELVAHLMPEFAKGVGPQ